MLSKSSYVPIIFRHINIDKHKSEAICERYCIFTDKFLSPYGHQVFLLWLSIFGVNNRPLIA